MDNDIFNIVGSSLAAQNARMGVIAANLANANSIAPPGVAPYRAHEEVFEAADAADGETDAPAGLAVVGGGTPDAGGAPDAGGTPDADGTPDMGVTVLGSVQSNAPLKIRYDPSSPYADANGNVTGSNVQPVDEMVNLIDSSTSYAASVAVLQQTSRIDQQMLTSFQVT
jgi:flagellar basal-body rod protein FlgC